MAAASSFEGHTGLVAGATVRSIVRPNNDTAKKELIGKNLGDCWYRLMVARTLLIVTALVETPIGLMLVVSPPLVAGLLLGVSLDAPAALIVGRIAGAALLSLGGACWLARDDGPSRARRGVVAAMLLYNSAAGAVLANAGAGVRLVGVLMWPAVALHAVLAVWCIACLRSGSANVSGRARTNS
jgi:hypothetical protein